MGCRCTRRWRRSSGRARRRGLHPRFMDAKASCEPSPGSAVVHAPAGQPRCRQRFRAGSEKSPSSRCPQAAAACSALHAPSAYMPASQARTGIRHEEGPGVARERAAPLRHSAARCRVANRTHAAQARLHTRVCAIEHLLTTNLRLCQNARHRTSLAAAADTKLRYAAMVYTRAKTLARKAACGALHAPSAYMPASQARTGIRHEEGPGPARERAAPLRHSAARCRVANRTHAAQARLHTRVCAIEHLLTTNLRLCQNARHRTSLAAAADMKLRCSGRHEAQVRGDAVHARENTSPD